MGARFLTCILRSSRVEKALSTTRALTEGWAAAQQIAALAPRERPKSPMELGATSGLEAQ